MAAWSEDGCRARPSQREGCHLSRCEVSGRGRWVRNPREIGMAAPLTCLARVPVRSAGQRGCVIVLATNSRTSDRKPATQSVLRACRASALGKRRGMALREGGGTRFCGAYGRPSVLRSAVSMEHTWNIIEGGVHAPVMGPGLLHRTSPVSSLYMDRARSI